MTRSLAAVLLVALVVPGAVARGQPLGTGGAPLGMGGAPMGMARPLLPQFDDGPLPDDADGLVAALAGPSLAYMTQLRSTPRTRGTRAADRLREMQAAALPALARGLESADRTIRLNSVFVLNEIDAPPALPIRLRGVADPDPEVRASAVGGLPAFGDDEAHRALLRALGDPQAVVRKAAIWAFLPRKGAPGEVVARDVATRLIPLLDDPATRGTAVEVLGRLKSDVATLPLARLLKADDRLDRTGAARALGSIRDRRATPELVAALRDPDAIVRCLTAQALCEVVDPRAAPALTATLSDPDANVRRDAATALGRIGARDAVAPLIPLLGDPDDRVRAAAATALGAIGDPRAVEPLGRALVGNGREIGSVVRALGLLRDPRAIRPLRDFALRGEDRSSGRSNVREALEALGRIRDPDAIEALVRVATAGPDDGTWSRAAQVLRQLGAVDLTVRSKEEVARWWDRNRESFLDQVLGPAGGPPDPTDPGRRPGRRRPN